jgi:hypothetical protein
MTAYSQAVKGNSILYAGVPLIKEYLIGTASECYPGRLVEIDSTANTVKAGADNSVVILGVLDVEPTEAITTVYDSADPCRVLSGHIIVWLLAISGATIAVGGKVQCAGNGKVDQAATAYADVGKAIMAKSGATDEWILVELYA